MIKREIETLINVAYDNLLKTIECVFRNAIRDTDDNKLSFGENCIERKYSVGASQLFTKKYVSAYISNKGELLFESYTIKIGGKDCNVQSIDRIEYLDISTVKMLTDYMLNYL